MSENKRVSKYHPIKRPRSYWITIWVSGAIFLILLIVIFELAIDLSPQQYKTLALALVILCILTFIISMKVIPGGYSISKQAICYQGILYTKRDGYYNIKALIFFLIYCLTEAMLIILVGHIVHLYSNFIKNISFLNIACYLGAFVVGYLGFIPIDVNEKLHYLDAMFVVIFVDIFDIYLFIILTQVDIATVSLDIALAGVVIFTILYIIGMKKRYRYAAVPQKLWILSTSIIFYLFVEIIATNIPIYL